MSGVEAHHPDGMSSDKSVLALQQPLVVGDEHVGEVNQVARVRWTASFSLPPFPVRRCFSFSILWPGGASAAELMGGKHAQGPVAGLLWP